MGATFSLPIPLTRDNFKCMQPTSEMSAFDRGVRPIMKIVLPEKAEEVVEFRADPELQARIEE
jgi:hypothetical protein